MKIKLLTKAAKSGDIFYIPAIGVNDIHGFVLARYIELLQPNVGYLIEVFDKFYVEPPVSINQIEKSRRLFRPIMFDMYFYYVPRWKVLFQDATYDKEHSKYSDISIAFHTELWVGGKSFELPPKADKKFEGATCWSPHHIIFRVNAHLAGIFGPDERYDYHRVPRGQRVDDSEAFEKVVALAEDIDDKFKIWARCDHLVETKNNPLVKS